ncbi:MAG: hypothetical protein KBC20_02330 [Oscillospiraceae bacterium]|nr:hypothetical protein [Oscillospiraceae bacterium]
MTQVKNLKFLWPPINNRIRKKKVSAFGSPHRGAMLGGKPPDIKFTRFWAARIRKDAAFLSKTASFARAFIRANPESGVPFSF